MSSAATARSPSPGPVARPCGGLRRSADSSPFRNIVSTPDSPQRSVSVGRNSGGGRASSRALWAEKENDNNNQQRDAARTPNKPARYSTGGGGGAKSFMAPTISAASKAVAASASPRKKVLGERNNDPTHPVVSSSSPGDFLAHAKPRAPPPTPLNEEALGAPRRLRLSLDGAPAPPPAAAPPVASHGARLSLGGEADVENPVCEGHHHNDGPCDAAAPYDPKTNYLSPRPQFLRYKPNPRVELYRQGGVRRLEDGFASSESSEETDAATTTEEEGLSEEEHESSPPAPASDAGADTVTADVLASEPAPISPLSQALTPEPEEPTATSPPVRTPASVLEPVATPARAAAKRKRPSLRFILVAPFALALVMVASLVCVPPAPGSPVVLNASLSKASEYFLSVQELHPVELAAWLKQWSSSSLDYVSSYWSALASPREQEFFGPHIATNLSAAVADDADHCLGFYYSAVETRPTPTVQEPISANILEEEMEEVASASDALAIEEEMEEVASASDAFAIEEDMAAFGDATVQDEPIDAEMFQESVSETQDTSSGTEKMLYDAMADEVLGSSGEGTASSNEELDITSQSQPEPEHTVDDMDVPSLPQDVQTVESESDQKEAHAKKDQEAHHGQKLGSDMWSRYLDNFSKPAVAGSVLTVLVVSAALAFLYMRQNQARVSSNPNEPTEQVEQVENRSGSGSSEGHALEKGSHFQNPVVEETGRIGDSGPSQYSSSLSSGLSRRRKDKEEQSLEPMSRRESTGYSTSSYGSFTTYEKIPAKKKNKEDEAMTPVRRSSRLRNQVKSPEA